MYEVNATASNVEQLIESIKSYNPSCNQDLIRKAYDLAESSHAGQTRDSGEPYIMHPLAVASILAELHLDDTTIMAGLLHDVVEDTEITLEQIAQDFSPDMALLIDGVTKLNKLAYRSKHEQQAENLRKMFLAMAKDVRIILIKLADRLHNMRTLDTHHSDLRKKEIALETSEIFAPLAHRLGIYKIKWEMEDLSLKYQDPEAYEELQEQISMKYSERQVYLSALCDELHEKLLEVGIKSEIVGRPKNYYSIYRKMVKQRKDINEIYDIHAVRVLVDTVKDCYGALGIVHTLWKPIPGRFKDYIAMPKANMYQSIHTTLIGPQGRPFEVQIRTWEMHDIAEYGIAAHWKYKEEITDNNSSSKNDAHLNWLRQMLDWQKDLNDAKEFVENIKGDLYGDSSVFVFSPKADVVELPQGATPIDFAYRVHTQVGHQCVGAKINNRIVPLDTILVNGDIVEILTTRGSGPSRDWLKIVRTSQAKNKIRQWFRKEERDSGVVQRGKDLLEKEAIKHDLDAAIMFKSDRISDIAKRCGYVSADDMFVAVAEGAATTLGVINKIKDDDRLKKVLLKPTEAPEAPKEMVIKPFSDNGHNDKGVWVKGESDVMVNIANCCKPLPGDEITGYVTRGRGVSVHRTSCPNIKYYRENEPERLINVLWDREAKGLFQAGIEVRAMDRGGLAMDLVAAISETKTVINYVNFSVDKDKVLHGEIKVEIKNLGQLEYLINKVMRVKDVIEVERKLVDQNFTEK